MKISIITVCYNSAATLKDTILSVASQSYKNIEYVIIDGGSKDATLEIIDQYKDTITTYISEPDKGLYDAMNKGINLASGEVVGFLNSDDLFCDDYALEKVMSVFIEKNFLDSVFSDVFYVSQNDISNIVRHWVTGAKRPFKFGWHPAHPTLYIKKKVYDNFGGFNLDFKLAADFEIMLRFMEKHKISSFYLKIPLVKMRLGGKTNKSLKNIVNQNFECIRAFKKNELHVNKFIYPFLRLFPKLIQFNKKIF